jgi:polyisoprenoid-binding protein YceI
MNDMRRAKGTIHVFTFKDGVLSAVAHDLRIRLEQFAITLEGDDVHAEFDLKSLFLDGPVRDGVVHPDDYEASKRADVEKAMHNDVLRTSEHPTARFVGKATPNGEGFAVSGELALAGQRAPLAFEVRRDNGTYRAEVELVPSRWGIAQYKALLGAIRLKDVLRVDLALADA